LRLILGSSSEHRRQLLSKIGVCPDEVRPSLIDETPLSKETPVFYCRRMAREKINSQTIVKGEIVLCADTTVAVGRRILGKPQDREQAKDFLNLLSGKRHTVITCVTLSDRVNIWEREVISKVKFKSLSAKEIKNYLSTDEWRGKAGGYAIQGMAAAFIPWIRGSFSAIVGLPLMETYLILSAAGYDPMRSKT